MRPRSTRRLGLLVASCLLLFPTACAADSGLTALFPPDFEQRLYHQDYEFLSHTQLSVAEQATLAERDDGLGYYLGVIAGKKGRSEEAKSILRSTVENAPRPWGSRARRELLDLLSEIGDYERILDDYRSGFWEGVNLRSVASAVSEAAVRLDRPDELLAFASATEPASLGATAEEFALRLAELVRDEEKELLEGYLSYLVADRPPARAHRVLELMIAEGRAEQLLSASELRLLAMKAALVDGRYTEAADRAEEWLRDGPRDADAQIESLVWAFSAANRRERGAELLLSMAGASAEGRGRLIFAAARLYRVQQRYRRAAELLEEAASLVRESEQDRVLWYGLSSALRGGSDDAAAAIATFLAPARRPAFFEDALEDYLSERLRRQAIGDIVETARVVFDYGSPRSRAQWAVVLDELLAIGRVSAQDVPSLSEELALARGQADSLYYRILAGGELDPMNPEPKAIRASDMPRSELSASEAFVAGYMRFGLRRRAYRAAREGRADMGDRFLLSLGYELQSLGMVTEGMRVGDVVSARRTEASEPELLRDLRFPRAFPEEFSRVTEDHQLKEALFYALVREESYFQPRVRSRVGAIGLSQLMPATAEDIARRRRMAALDLEDPQTNLDLGGWYFSWLETRVPTPMHAVAAYNGGQGRIRRWVEEWSWMTPLLFNEAIPMRETRFHVRKVLVSAVHYGYPRELFFEPFPQE